MHSSEIADKVAGATRWRPFSAKEPCSTNAAGRHSAEMEWTPPSIAWPFIPEGRAVSMPSRPPAAIQPVHLVSCEADVWMSAFIVN
jgi:hypothetical protein